MNSTATKPRSPLASMPEVAAFLADVGRAFGKEVVLDAVADGVSGVPGRFHAREGGVEYGTPFPPDGIAFTGAEIVLDTLMESLKKGRQ